MFYDGGGFIVGNTTATTTDGMIRATNDIIAFYSSDRRLKTDIIPIPDALSKVMQISGNSFTWIPLTDEEKKTIHANEGKDIGVIAQEIEKVLPELVETREKTGYKAVKYDKLTALLIEAVKELNEKVIKLENKLK
tara:strand:- start:194 stop:601 length:408 start_codon:yes stop_codon:yes gene_type:complete